MRWEDLSLLSVYWRTCLVIVTLILLWAIAIPLLGLFAFIDNPDNYPTAFCLLMAASFFLIEGRSGRGLVHLLWGQRLRLPDIFWRQLNLLCGYFFVGFALLALLISEMSTLELWGYYKLIGQPCLFLCTPMLGIKYLLIRHQG